MYKFKKKKYIFYILILICLIPQSILLSQTNITKKLKNNNITQKITILDTPLPNLPHIILYFSFFYKSCYYLEYKHNLSEYITKKTKKKIHLTNINLLNNTDNKTISKLWILTKWLKLKNIKEILNMIFINIHDKPINISQILNNYIKLTKINKNLLIKLLNNNTLINTKLKEDHKLFNSLNKNILPIFLVEGRYIIGDKIQASSYDDYIKQCIQIINIIYQENK